MVDIVVVNCLVTVMSFPFILCVGLTPPLTWMKEELPHLAYSASSSSLRGGVAWLVHVLPIGSILIGDGFSGSCPYVFDLLVLVLAVVVFWIKRL